MSLAGTKNEKLILGFLNLADLPHDSLTFSDRQHVPTYITGALEVRVKNHLTRVKTFQPFLSEVEMSPSAGSSDTLRFGSRSRVGGDAAPVACRI